MPVEELKTADVMPRSMRRLPVHRGFPVPWFVAYVNGQPEFRIMDQRKWRLAVSDRLCLVCGSQLGRYTFVLGPMCGVTRTTAEPPCHLDCAVFSVRNCPFLSRPHMERRENGLPETREVAGIGIRRNPGVTLLWSTRSYKTFDDGKGGKLIEVGSPTDITFWREGRAATRAEVIESVESGLPILVEQCHGEAGAFEELMQRKAWMEARYPTR